MWIFLVFQEKQYFFFSLYSSCFRLKYWGISSLRNSEPDQNRKNIDRDLKYKVNSFGLEDKFFPEVFLSEGHPLY